MSSDSPTTRPMTGQSTSSTQGGESKKKRGKKNHPISLEEVFNQLSSVTSSNLNPPAGKIVLTPRSAEVCLKLGVNPEILKIRDIDSFWEPGMDAAVQRIRHEAYVQRRHDIMKECRLEKKRLNIAEFEAATNMNQVETLTPEMILEQQREQSSTLIQLEMQRIQKMQKRQQKELEQMIQVRSHALYLSTSYQSINLSTYLSIYLSIYTHTICTITVRSSASTNKCRDAEAH